jgi:hypothetical protein
MNEHERVTHTAARKALDVVADHAAFSLWDGRFAVALLRRYIDEREVEGADPEMEALRTEVSRLRGRLIILEKRGARYGALLLDAQDLLSDADIGEDLHDRIRDAMGGDKG